LGIDDGKKFKPLYRGLRKVIPAPALASARLALPPVASLESILNAVSAATKSTDAALANTEKEIALLQEYRACLISDVVTGEKDIRLEATAMKDVDHEELAEALAGTFMNNDVDDTQGEDDEN